MQSIIFLFPLPISMTCNVKTRSGQWQKVVRQTLTNMQCKDYDIKTTTYQLLPPLLDAFCNKIYCKVTPAGSKASIGWNGVEGVHYPKGGWYPQVNHKQTMNSSALQDSLHCNKEHSQKWEKMAYRFHDFCVQFGNTQTNPGLCISTKSGTDVVALGSVNYQSKTLV